MDIFIEITYILAVAAVISFIMYRLKQPLIVGYIFTGILVGPYVFNLLHSVDQIELFSKLGIAILLFIVGLHLSPSVIRQVGRVSLIAGVGQVIFTSFIGFVLVLLLGFSYVSSLYIAISLTFSSTIIILKLLSDRGDLDKLYGKIAVGILIIQDIIATFLLLIISSFSQSLLSNIVLIGVFLLVKFLIVILSLYLISVYVLPYLLSLAARSQEMLFLFSITWGLVLSAVFYKIGFSVEIGALIAGVILSATPYSYEIGSRLKPLRDFFIVVFFILLGSQMVLDKLSGLFIPTVILSLFVLFGNPLIVFVLMNLAGYKRRVSYMTGLTVAQISEFSLILASLGYQLGHISENALSLITMVGLVTIAGSTYFILYAEKMYKFIEPLLARIEIVHPKKTLHGEKECIHSFLFGFDRVGMYFIKAFEHLRLRYMVVDFNPHSIARLEKEHIPYRFGDAEDIEFLSELSLHRAKLVISTIPSFDTNILLTRFVKKENPKAIVIVIAHTRNQAKKLYDEGATYVFMPHYLGASYVSRLIRKFGLLKRLYHEKRDIHLKSLLKD